MFWIYPLFKAFQISLYQWALAPGQESTFIGLANYLRAFHDPVFWIALRNTVLYVVVTVPIQTALALAVAVLLDRIRWGRVLFRTLYYLPVITSWVIVSVLFRYLFSQGGLVNYVLKDVLGLISTEISWFTHPATAMSVVMLLEIWKGIGWSMVIFLAALQAIPLELHEAATVDGANVWACFWRITLPLMRPTVVFVLVMRVIGTFNVFTSVYLILGGIGGYGSGPTTQTEVILAYMYRQAFKFLDFGYGAALAYLLAALILVISLLQIRFFRRPVEMY
jgi:multiple sugar transport system permease protein